MPLLPEKHGLGFWIGTIALLALAITLAPLPRPLLAPKSLEWIRAAAITTGVLGATCVIDLTACAVSCFLQAGHALDPAPVSLELTPGSYAGFGRQYHGEIEGQELDIYYQPAQTIKPALLAPYVSADVGAKAAMGTKRPLPDCRDCPTVGLEAPEPNRLHVIAHRLSTIRSADLIVVLKGTALRRWAHTRR